MEKCWVGGARRAVILYLDKLKKYSIRKVEYMADVFARLNELNVPMYEINEIIFKVQN